LTLTGPGGVGKSRLALRLAELCREAFPQGMTVVSLAPVRQPGDVATAIVQAFDARG
jgi:predicted ATPase